MKCWIAVAAAVWITMPPPLCASGCFGGHPDIVPRDGSAPVPSNTRIVIARRAPAAASWIGPDGREVRYREEQVGHGPASARILESDAPLKPGVHTIRTVGPDATQTFRVAPSVDAQPPRLSGSLKLESFNAPEPSSECPENIYIRAVFDAPEDDRTRTEDLAYLVRIQRADGSAAALFDLIMPAESIVRGQVFLRFGETGCGCIPRVTLQPGAAYRVAVRAIDLAGHRSTNGLSGTINVPAAVR